MWNICTLTEGMIDLSSINQIIRVFLKFTIRHIAYLRDHISYVTQRAVVTPRHSWRCHTPGTVGIVTGIKTDRSVINVASVA